MRSDNARTLVFRRDRATEAGHAAWLGVRIGEHCKREQPCHAGYQAIDESADGAPAALIARPPKYRLGDAARRIVGQSALAFDHSACHVTGDCVYKRRHLIGFRKNCASISGVLHETVLTLVATHLHMRYDVDPEPRHVAFAHATVEQFDVTQ